MRELKLFVRDAHTHTHTLPSESQEKRCGLELYSLFIAVLPFIWASSLYTAPRLLQFSDAIVAK